MDQRLRDGIAAAQARRLDEARALLQQAVEAAPDDPLAWFWLAAVSPTADAAIAHLRRALALDPTHAAARSALVRILLSHATRSRDAARRLFREAGELAPDDPAVWRGVAQTASSSAEALAGVRDLQTLAPAFQDGRVFLVDALVADARAHAAAGDRTASRERWREAAALDAGRAEIWIGLAQCSDDDSEVRSAVAKAAAIVDGLRRADAPVVQPAMEHASQPAPAAAPPAAVSAARTVLVVDDSPTIRKILSLTLEHAGYSVVAEADGESALRRLDDVRPVVVLLDIAMPGLDGYETCKRIKGDARTAHLPVLMLSGKDALFDKVKGHMAGATEYLTKPFDASTVLTAVAGACAPAA
jgi:twitching motility two-component system response regulator PilG